MGSSWCLPGKEVSRFLQVHAVVLAVVQYLCPFLHIITVQHTATAFKAHLFHCDSNRWPCLTTRTIPVTFLFSAKEVAKFNGWAMRGEELIEVIKNSIAPKICGHEDIKLAVACLLFGGCRKVRPKVEWQHCLVQEAGD